MKKSFIRITFFIVSLILFSGWFNRSEAQFYFGGKAGLTSFKIKGSDTYGGINYKYGANAGMVLGLKLVTDFSIQAELLYSQKGFKQKFTESILSSGQDPTTGAPMENDTTTKYKNSLSLSYIEVPILIKKSFSFHGGIQPYNKDYSIIDLDLFVGPYVGYLMGASASFSSLQSTVMKVNDTVRSTTDETEQTAAHSFRMGQQGFTVDTSGNISVASKSVPFAKSGLNSIDVGLIVGGGFSIELSAHVKLFIDARYSMGLLTIDNTYFNNDKPTLTSSGLIVNTKSKLNLTNGGLVFNVGIIKYMGK